MGLFSTGLSFNNGLQSQRQFVAVARTTGVNENVTDVVMTSLDGITWTTRNIAYGYFQGTNLEAVTWSSSLNLWVAGQSVNLPNSGVDRIWTSPDGINWSSRNLPTPAVYGLSVRSVIWIPALGKFLATGDDGSSAGFYFSSSTDGITWISNSGDTSLNYFYTCLAYSPSLNRTVALRTSAQAGQYSNDLTSWTTIVISGAANAGWQAVVWAPELSKFIAVSDTSYGTKAAYSSDGITWTLSTPTELVNWKGLAWSPKLGIAVAVASTGTTRIMYTSDGINWSNSGISGAGASYAWNSVTWSDDLELFVAVGGLETMHSKDGLTWIYAAGSLTGTRDLQFVSWGGIYNG